MDLCSVVAQQAPSVHVPRPSFSNFGAVPADPPWRTKTASRAVLSRFASSMHPSALHLPRHTVRV